MVDALVSNVLQQLGTIIEKEIEQEVRLVVGVEKEIDQLSTTLLTIRAALKDAEEKQVKDASVRLWLQKLKDVAYDIDDVLDEWSTAIILKSQIDINKTDEKVWPCNLFSHCCCLKQIGLRRDISHKVKGIKERLDKIASEKDKFCFIETTPKSEIIGDQSRRRSLETSSFVDVSEVFGRDMDKKIIISKLISESSSSQEKVGIYGGVPLISIVAMGGMGKTTLAQLVFNDERVKNHFSKRLWIYVSKPFDKVRVAMHIIKEIGGNIVTVTQGGNENITWEAVHRQLNSCVDGKHFLLVLDDVWNEDPREWEPLRLSLKCGAQGSRIIVTTRNERVADIMDTTYVHRLGLLSDDACWSLLNRYAFVGRQEEECKQLEEIGMKLANKCNGLPLSAKTLGSLLRFKKSKRDWQGVLLNDVWKVVSSTHDKSSVLPVLLLSYNDLPSHLQQCFAYSSLTPINYQIDNVFITKEWMAQGFLSDSSTASGEDLIAVGDEHFNNLVMRSFFQIDVSKSRGSFQSCKMHELVHEFAKSLVEGECITLTIKDASTDQEFNFSRARHLYLLIEEIKEFPCFIYKAKSLRTLRIFGQIPLVSSELFNHLTCLRTLDLSDTYLEELPNEIEKLIHLRYINLSGAMIKELPEAVTSLHNLQTLHLFGCRNLSKLPQRIWRLVNLMVLNVAECRQLNYLPEGIGRLTRLQYLSSFIIGGAESGECTIGELKDLNSLKGSLFIIGLSGVKNVDDARIACLRNKQHLRCLYFYFNRYTGVSLVDETVIDEEGENREEKEVAEGGEDMLSWHMTVVQHSMERGEDMFEGGYRDTLSRRMKDVLESLQPHPYIEKLVIRDYFGAVFPNWMVSHAEFITFSNLVFLDLSSLANCKQLPSALGKLPSLETLVLQGIRKVKLMDVEFFAIHAATRNDGGVDTIFPKLKVFLLGGMPNLEKWDMRVQEEDGKQVRFMPCLQYLVLIHLPKLRSFPQHLTHATSLRKLFIWNCPALNWIPSPSSHLPCLHIEELILKENAGSFSWSLLVALHNHTFLPKLKLLRVRMSPYPSLPQGLGELTSLEILDIRTCPYIKSMPDVGELQHLTALKELRIMRCSALRQRCQKEIGEDWNKISHIPTIFIDGEKIK